MGSHMDIYLIFPISVILNTSNIFSLTKWTASEHILERPEYRKRNRVPHTKQNLNNHTIKIFVYHTVPLKWFRNTIFPQVIAWWYRKANLLILLLSQGSSRKCLRFLPGVSCIGTGIWCDSSRLWMKYLKCRAFLMIRRQIRAKVLLEPQW